MLEERQIDPINALQSRLVATRRSLRVMPPRTM